MTQEEYNQLDFDFAHCAGTHCEKAGQCLRHTAYTMLESGGRERYMMLNSKVINGAQPCSFFEPDRKERFAWGISRIYDNVRVPDLDDIRHNLIYTFGRTAYYRIKRKERVLTESEQQEIREVFKEMGYDGSAIEFDCYEEQYPTLMRTYKFV
ncbi:hypothetical protein JCM15754A_06010 [Prevotella aurantiaca JCM 15754]|uniref:DUF6078 family protein n=1 Tax=Prevotella aurantiaca TaxID=596085 RepID=UPI00046883ED|nr:DUF6078 family protein [Prevotella aurantiaca]